MQNKNTVKQNIAAYLLALLGFFSVIGVDQLTKYYVSENLLLGETRGFLKGVIDIVYIHNRGSAWGMFSGYTYLLITLTALVMVFCVFLFIKYGKNNKLMLWALTLALAGGIGNLIDRVARDGNVVDFLHFTFWPSFPVFNVADCSIVAGAGLIIIFFVLDAVKETKNKNGSTDTENEQN